MPWYYEVDRQQRGPVSDEEFAALVQGGMIRAESLVWQPGWADWRSYGSVAGGGAAGSLPDADSAVCAVSGRRLPKSEMLEFEGRWVGVEHKDEFFQRLREGVNIPNEMVYASFGRRLGAKLIDWVIVTSVTLVINGLLGVLMLGSFWGTATGGNFEFGMLIGYQILSNLISIGLGLGYAIYFIRKDDATPGKKVLGLRLVRADGTKLGVGRIIGRHFSEIVSTMIIFIGYIMAAFDKEQRRALHDHMCDTRVIDVRGA